MERQKCDHPICVGTLNNVLLVLHVRDVSKSQRRILAKSLTFEHEGLPSRHLLPPVARLLLLLQEAHEKSKPESVCTPHSPPSPFYPLRRPNHMSPLASTSFNTSMELTSRASREDCTFSSIIIQMTINCV